MFRGFIAVGLEATAGPPDPAAGAPAMADPPAPLPGVVRLLQTLAATGADLKVVDPANLHVTLAFLGDVPEERTGDVVAAMQESSKGIGPCALVVRGVGSFPPRGAPRVVWAGLEGAEPLAALVPRLRRALASRGLPEGDAKPFVPHVTLARMRSPRGAGAVRDFLLREPGESCGETRVDEVRLMRSVLRPSGPEYAVVGRVRLEG